MVRLVILRNQSPIPLFFPFGLFIQAGIQSIHYPIHDKWIPSEMIDFIACVTRVVAEIQLGRIILVHCNGGKGRTGLFSPAFGDRHGLY